MRKIAATYIYPVTSQPIKYGILYLDDNNTIVKIIDNNGKMVEEEGCEYYNGIITPGFINAHTHLELSYLKNLFERGAGMRQFLKTMMTKPKTNVSEIAAIAEYYDKQMYNQGIVAVGDICNTTDTLEVKTTSKIHYHSFIELYGLSPKKSTEIYSNGITIRNEYIKRDLPSTITPHAPYSLSKNLLMKIYSENINPLLSIHILENSIKQENLSDNAQSFKSLYKQHGINDIENSVEHPFQLMLKDIVGKQLLTVHNTRATVQDWDIALDIVHRNNISLFAVTCPRSNMYINSLLPDYNQWPKEIPVCLGTDSLASNTDLSVFNEILFLLKKTDISFNKLLEWGTLNGARALMIDNKFGSLEIGKTPGVNLISQFDFEKNKPSDNATIRKLA